MNLLTRLQKVSWLAGFAVFFALGFLVFGGALSVHAPPQPIRFNHALHVEKGLDCEACHEGALKSEKATLPGIDTCMGCHQEPQSKSAEEEKIRGFARAGQPIPWVQVNRVPAHVFFSHRRHVTLGGMKCAECHGQMEKATSPPVKPFRLLTMDACIECHEQKRAGTDCNDCHR